MKEDGTLNALILEWFGEDAAGNLVPRPAGAARAAPRPFPSFQKYGRPALAKGPRCSSSAPTPDTLDTFRWFSCYLTNGAHFLFYQSFLVVFALLAVTAPTALAFGFAAAAARARDRPSRWLGKIYTAMVRGVPDIVFFLFFVLALDQGIEYLRHRSSAPTGPTRSGRAQFHRLPRGAHAAIGRAAMGARGLRLRACRLHLRHRLRRLCGNVLYGAMRAVPRAQLETAEAYGMTRARPSGASSCRRCGSTRCRACRTSG
jgi:hypothetical protein